VSALRLLLAFFVAGTCVVIWFVITEYKNPSSATVQSKPEPKVEPPGFPTAAPTPAAPITSPSPLLLPTKPQREFVPAHVTIEYLVTLLRERFSGGGPTPVRV
jgi:hypothetical protein